MKTVVYTCDGCHKNLKNDNSLALQKEHLCFKCKNTMELEEFWTDLLYKINLGDGKWSSPVLIIEKNKKEVMYFDPQSAGELADVLLCTTGKDGLNGF